MQTARQTNQPRHYNYSEIRKTQQKNFSEFCRPRWARWPRWARSAISRKILLKNRNFLHKITSIGSENNNLTLLYHINILILRENSKFPNPRFSKSNLNKQCTWNWEGKDIEYLLGCLEWLIWHRNLQKFGDFWLGIFEIFERMKNGEERVKKGFKRALILI